VKGVKYIQTGADIPLRNREKCDYLLEIKQHYGLSIFVETGTYMGQTVEIMRRHFLKVYSIELSVELYNRAVRKFSGCENVKLRCGDSGVELGEVMRELNEAALFWLDAHYSRGVTVRGDRETPIIEELRHILDAPDLGHVVVIDDAREFGEKADYPTMEQVRDFVLSRRNAEIVVKDDGIRILPLNSRCSC